MVDQLGTLNTLSVNLPKGFSSRQRRGSVSAEVDKDETKFQKIVIPKSVEALERIEKAVDKNFLFANLTADQKQDIFDSMREIKITAGQEVIRMGDTEADYFYVVDSGSYEILKLKDGEISKVWQYDGTGSFGELALMYNTARTATVRAVTDGVLWAVDRATFRHIIVDSTAKHRRLLEHFLERVPLLANTSKQERAQIADCLVTVYAKDKEYIIHQGELGDKFYLIEQGECIATQQVQDTVSGQHVEVEVGRMQAGQYFGERALITNQARAANVIAIGNVKLASLDRPAFERLLGPCTEIMKRQLLEYKSATAALIRSENMSEFTARRQTIEAQKAKLREREEELRVRREAFEQKQKDFLERKQRRTSQTNGR